MRPDTWVEPVLQEIADVSMMLWSVAALFKNVCVPCHTSNPLERQGMPSQHDSMQEHPAPPGLTAANTAKSQRKPLQCCETRVMHSRAGECQTVYQQTVYQQCSITTEGKPVSTPPNTITHVTALKRLLVVTTLGKRFLCCGFAAYHHPQVGIREEQCLYWLLLVTGII